MIRFILSLVVVVCLSCSKEKDQCSVDLDPIQILTQGTWKYTHLFVNDTYVHEGYSFDGDLLEGQSTCITTDNWIFNPDFSIGIESNSTTCTDYQHYGDWVVDGTQLTIRERNDNTDAIHVIDCLDQNEFSGIIQLKDIDSPGSEIIGQVAFTFTKN